LIRMMKCLEDENEQSALMGLLIVDS